MGEQKQLEPLELVTREEWGAVPAKEVDPPMEFPLPYAIVTFTSGTELGKTEEDCFRIMKDLQRRHMEEQGMSDIAYNFVVGGDGRVYEGRGWMTKPSNPKYPEYRSRLDIAYMGNLRRNDLSWEMFKSCVQLLSMGRHHNYLMRDFSVVEDPQTVEITNPDPDSD